MTVYFFSIKSPYEVIEKKYGGEIFLRKVPETNLYAKGCFFQDFYDLGQNCT